MRRIIMRRSGDPRLSECERARLWRRLEVRRDRVREHVYLLTVASGMVWAAAAALGVLWLLGRAIG